MNCHITLCHREPAIKVNHEYVFIWEKPQKFSFVNTVYLQCRTSLYKAELLMTKITILQIFSICHQYIPEFSHIFS